MSPHTIFNQVISQLLERHKHLAIGKMLSSPAIEYKGRAFAFCYRDTMIIKYGDTDQLMSCGIRATQEYRPFSNRMTFSQWREVPYYYRDDWTLVAEMALGALQDEIG